MNRAQIGEVDRSPALHRLGKGLACAAYRKPYELVLPSDITRGLAKILNKRTSPFSQFVYSEAADLPRGRPDELAFPTLKPQKCMSDA